jgi:hypothetical protein
VLSVESVLEEYIASIFRVKEYTKQEISLKAGDKQSYLTHALTRFLLSLFIDPED